MTDDPSRCVRLWIAAVGLCALQVLLAGCAENDGDGHTAEHPPAQVVSVTHARGNPDYYLYGEEMRLTFDRDPGLVDAVYDHNALGGSVVGEGTRRALLVLSPRAELRWDRGGSLVLEFDPLIYPDGGPPSTKGPRFPAPGATGVSVPELMERGVFFHVGAPFHRDNRMIPFLQTSQPTVTASDGRTWHPDFVTKLDRLTLLSDADNPFAGGLTYVARIDIWRTAYP